MSNIVDVLVLAVGNLLEKARALIRGKPNKTDLAGALAHGCEALTAVSLGESGTDPNEWSEAASILRDVLRTIQ